MLLSVCLRFESSCFSTYIIVKVYLRANNRLTCYLILIYFMLLKPLWANFNKLSMPIASCQFYTTRKRVIFTQDNENFHSSQWQIFIIFDIQVEGLNKCGRSLFKNNNDYLWIPIWERVNEDFCTRLYYLLLCTDNFNFLSHRRCNHYLLGPVHPLKIYHIKSTIDHHNILSHERRNRSKCNRYYIRILTKLYFIEFISILKYSLVAIFKGVS